MEPRLAELAAFGLSDPQIAAYTYLLNRDAAMAPEVASGAGVPRNRAYEILDSLAALGLVQVVSGRRRTYKALPVGPFLDRRIGEAQSNLERLRERKPTLERELTPSVDAQGFLGAFGTWRGRDSVVNATRRLLSDATEAIHVTGPPVAIHRWITPLFGDVLEERRADGLDVRVLVTLCDNESFDPLLDLPYKTTAEGGGVAKIVVDRRALLVRSSDGWKDDEAYELRHEGLAAEAVSHFEHLWGCESARVQPADTRAVPVLRRTDTP